MQSIGKAIDHVVNDFKLNIDSLCSVGNNTAAEHVIKDNMPQRGQTNLVIWDIAGHIPYQGRDCICSFVIYVFFPIILALNLWFGEKSDRQPRSTSGDCITSWNKPSI